MTQRHPTRRIAVLIAVGVPLAALVLITWGWKRGGGPFRVEQWVSYALFPAQEGLETARGALRSTGRLFTEWRNLRRDNRRLREEVRELRRRLQAGDERELTCRRLEEVLSFTGQAAFSVTVASVIGRDSTNLFRTIVIDKGARDGVRPKQPVLTPDGVVGRTVKVFPRSSLVLLLVDRSFGVDALVQRTRDRGVVKGLDPAHCEMKYLSRQADVEPGDLVITSGLGGIFPKGLPVGRIVSVTRSGYLFQKTKIVPAAEIDRLEEVLVAGVEPE